MFNIPNLSLYITASSLVVGILLFVFTYWWDGIRDGFDKFRLLDLSFSILGVSFLLSYYFHKIYVHVSLIVYKSPLLLISEKLWIAFLCLLFAIILSFIYSKLYAWSIYRLLDIFSIGVSLLGFVAVLGIALYTRTPPYLFVSFFFLFFYLFLCRRRRTSFISGVLFSLFLLALTLIGLLFFRVRGYLIVYSSLVIISLVNLYLRKRIIIMPTRFTDNIMKRLRNRLISMEADLNKAEKLLKEEDSYMQEGRAEDNSSRMDEAILEDASKELTEVRLSAIRVAKHRIRKALTFMKLGKYGKCEVCGMPIKDARLLADPTVTKCIKCAKNHS